MAKMCKFKTVCEDCKYEEPENIELEYNMEGSEAHQACPNCDGKMFYYLP